MSKIKKRTINLIIAIIAYLIITIVDKSVVIPIYISLPIYILIYLFIGHNILKKAFTNIIYGKVLDENFLMTVATIGAFATGEFSEAVLVILFYQVGELFQTLAVRRSRKNIASLMDIRPDYANVMRNGQLTVVPPEEVEVGEIIEIKPGEKVPLDGLVLEGSSNLNTSMLTGESLPTAVETGKNVVSGCINIDGVLRVEVTKKFENSTVNKILNMVQNASEKKSKSENFITKFAKIYTPIVCVLALILAIIPPIFVGNWTNWIYRALCFLVVSCPCALVISIPLGFFAGIGCASKNGILVKGSTYIEKLDKLDKIVFDKTGTLTTGSLTIQSIIPEENKAEILKFAYIAEYKSTHPIAKTIIDASDKSEISGYKYKTIIGKGIIAESKTEKILAGNAKFLKDNHIKFDEIDTCNTIVYIAVNDKYLGAITVGDNLKEETKSVIAELKSRNISSIILSGDNDKIVKNVCEDIGIDNYYSELLPNEKMDKLEEIIKYDNGEVAFVGDGINDSPSLMRADIGISMGKLGTDSAIEASDVVIMNDNLNKLIEAKSIATKTMTIVKENIIFAIGVKIIILILSALGLSDMWLAIFGDVGVSIVCILNSIRMLNYNNKKVKNKYDKTKKDISDNNNK